MPTVTNWAQTLTIQPSQILRPDSLAALRSQVTSIVMGGGNLLPWGARYSFSDCIQTHQTVVSQDALSDAWILTNDARSPIPDLLDEGAWGPGTGAAEQSAPSAYGWVEGGTIVESLCVACRQRDLKVAPFTLGGSTGQTLVGAVSTSTHGADFEQFPLPEYVAALHVITGGGQDLWLERPRPEGRITKDDGVAKLLGVSVERVRFDRTGTALNAALVSLGAGGVIAGALIRLRSNDLMNERMYQVGWDKVRASLLSQSVFTAPPGEDTRDKPSGTYCFAEILLNAYDASPTAFVVARNELPDDGRAVNPLRRSPLNLGQFVLAVGSQTPDYSGALAVLIKGSRLTGAQSKDSTGWVFYRFLDVIDEGIPQPQPVYSYELVWDVAELMSDGTPAYVTFLDRAVREVKNGLAIHRPFLGTVSLRFTRGTSAFLGMQYSANPTAVRFAHIEISPLQDVFNNSPALPAQNRSFLHAVFGDPSASRARPHWGQGVFGDLVFDAGRLALPAWQASMRDLLQGTRNFQSDFCRSVNATF